MPKPEKSMSNQQGEEEQRENLKPSFKDTPEGICERYRREADHEAEFRGANWCYKVIYIVILIGLTAIIMGQILIDHQLKTKESNKFLKNLEELRREDKEKKDQEEVKSTENKLQSSQKEEKSNALSEKVEAVSGLNLSRQKPETRQAGKVIQPADSPIQAAPHLSNMRPALPISQQPPTQKKVVYNHQNTASTPSKSARLIPATRERTPKVTYGSGISQPLLQKARIRKSLTKLPLDSENQISLQEFEYYERTYNISQYKQLPICVVIPTYNNVKNNRYLDNIKSVVMQNYTNYHIVVIDDASTDRTGELILEYLKGQKKVGEDRFEVIRNAEQMRAMHNLRFAAKNYCKPNDIFIIVDGDDQLIGRQVFKLFSAKFQADDLWYMYSNFLSLSGKIGYSRSYPSNIIIDNKYRQYPFITSHLRAFYTQLFLNVREEDLRDEKGEYLKAANDVAICIPVMEQAHRHIEYVPEITYFYNSNTGLNNHAIRLKEQRSNDKKIRTRPKYSQLKQLFPLK